MTNQNNKPPNRTFSILIILLIFGGGVGGILASVHHTNIKREVSSWFMEKPKQNEIPSVVSVQYPLVIVSEISNHSSDIPQVWCGGVMPNTEDGSLQLFNGFNITLYQRLPTLTENLLTVTDLEDRLFIYFELT